MGDKAPVKVEQARLATVLADKYMIDREQFLDVLKKTVFPADKPVNNAQAAAFMIVASQYELNPFTKEIYAFPAKDGGIIPVVSVDGWLKIANSHPQFDGIELTDNDDKDGKIVSVTAKVYRKDRKQAVIVTEHLSECVRDTDPWKRYPRRMLRHKAAIQGIRYAFSFAGIYDPDEAERIQDAEYRVEDAAAIETNTKAKLAELEGKMTAAKGLPSPTAAQEAQTVIGAGKEVAHDQLASPNLRPAPIAETSQNPQAEAEDATPDWIESGKDDVLDEIWKLAESLTSTAGNNCVDAVLHDAGLAKYDVLKKRPVEKLREALKSLQNYTKSNQ